MKRPGLFLIALGGFGLLAMSSLPAGDPVPAVAIKKKQSLIKGLLVRELGAATFAGSASQMNATALPNSRPADPSTLKFNQQVGPDMEKALKEVRKHLTVRHNGWPAGHDIEISWEEKYGPKDGPSAAVACALLLESLITGSDIDPKFAVTGDLNADGSVQPVGGVADKIRGAASRDCQVVAIPKSCANQIADAILIEGPKPVYSIQVLTIERFDDAIAASAAIRDANFASAIAAFATVQDALQHSPNPVAALHHPKMIERLQQVVGYAPTHLSAKLLLDFARGGGPKFLSLGGSLAQIDKATDELLKAIKTGRPDALSPDQVAVAMSGLNHIRASLDQRTWHYADSIRDFGETIRTIKNQPPKSNPEIAKANQRIQEKGKAVDAEVDHIRTNKALMEELAK